MADLITTIKVNSNQFDNSIKESTNQIRKFKSEGDKAGKGVGGFEGKLSSIVGGGLAKFAGGLGVGITAVEGFKKVINATQGTSDLFANTIGATTDTVDKFFKSISSGDFSNFYNGLGDVWERAKKTREELDQLWNTINAVSLAQTIANTKQMKGRDIANDPDLPKEERMKGLEMWAEGVKEYADATQTLVEDTESTVRSIVSTLNILDPDQITIPIITEAILVDAKGKPIRDAIKEQHEENYKEYLEKLEQARKESVTTTYKYSGKPNALGSQSRTRVTEVDQIAFRARASELGKEYREAIIAHSLLKKMEDDELKDLTDKLRSIEQQQGVIYQQNYQYSKGSQRAVNQMNKEDKSSGSNNKNKTDEILPEGSIAYYEQKISELNKELTLTVDPKTYKEIQDQIKKLEQKKFYLQFMLELDHTKYGDSISKVNPLFNTNAHSFSNNKINPNTGLTTEAINNISIQAEIQNLTNTLKKTQREARDATGKKSDELKDEIKDLKTRIALLSSVNGEGTGTIKPSILPASGSLLPGFGPTVDWSNEMDLRGYSSRLMNVLDGMEGLNEASIMATFKVSEEQVKEELAKVNTLLADMETVKIQAQMDHLEEFQNWQGAVYDLGDAFSYLGSAMGDAEGRGMKMIGTMITGINQLLPNIITLVAAEESKAYASAISSGAGLPFPWNIAAIAAGVAAVAANMASIPKFAEGGLVYGNTIAQVGEYAGASNNPEVIAPLSKLRKILAEDNVGGSSSVDFRIAGKDLVGVINNYSSKNKKK